MKYILYNPKSGNGKAEELASKMHIDVAGEDVMLVDVTTIKKYNVFFEGVSESDEVYLYGGDGTLNRFANDVSGIDLKNPVYYYPSGSGNDFATDVGKNDTTEPFRVDGYLEDLPTVTINGSDYKFVNGVGFGIDGYCCEIGDAIRLKGKKPNYTAIAIKGLLFHFKPVNATVIVDGKEYSYRKVWLAPAMFGGHYGGGMIPTPGQSRDGDPRQLSVLLFHGSGKIKTLTIFPSIFNGGHVKHKKYVEVLSGKEITVKFDRPTPLQIDGETVLGVTEYTARI